MWIVEQYLLQLKNEKRQLRRTVAILTVLSLLVAAGVAWNLRMTGITIANGANCGQEEHQHTEECPTEKILICGYPEYAYEEAATEPVPEETAASAISENDASAELAAEGSAAGTDAEPEAEDMTAEAAEDDASASGANTSAAETQPQHIHTDECYQTVYLCGCEEHIHSLSCYSDATADIESAAVWEGSLPELTGDWARDIALVAQSQLGCGESELNYIVADDGETRSGITRYGQWYGNPYGDWSSMFALFCLHYADIPEEAVPRSSGVYNMMRLAQDADIFLQPDSSMGCNGSLLFLDTDANGNGDRIAVVTACENSKLTAVCGDWENAVAEIKLSADDPAIMGYISVQQLQAVREAEDETAEPTDEYPTKNTDEATPEETQQETGEGADKPVISLDVEFPEEGIMRIAAQIGNIEEAVYTWQWQVSEDGNDSWVDIDGAAGLTCELEDTEENFRRYYRLQGRKAPVMTAMTVSAAGRSVVAAEDSDTILSEVFTPFSIDKNNRTYTIDVYAFPADAEGVRIEGIPLTELGSFSVTYNRDEIAVKSLFDADLGNYQSAYFGTAALVSVDDIDSVWCSRYYSKGFQYALAYRQTNGAENDKWLTGSNSYSSLYLRYTPEYTVTFESEGYESLSETVEYNGLPTLTEPGTWYRDGYKLLGWIVNGSEQNVYTYDELMKLPVTGDVTYTAKWASYVTVSFNLGEYAENLYPIDTQEIPYGSTISPLPTPVWRDNTAAMAFDGWCLNQELTEQVTGDHEFLSNTILYAKWSPVDEGYYVYFMDFDRGEQIPLVLATYSVTENQTVSPYTPGNAPDGTAWDGKWYLESSCTNTYNFSIPVSQMTDHLTGANERDLYLYPGTQDVCRAIFVTYGTKVDPVTVPVGGTIDLEEYTPERNGFEFAGWILQDGTQVSGVQTLTETTTFYATWNAGYVPFEAILRIENANDTGMTQADILGTWYAKSGSRIRVNSTYSGSGDNRSGSHEVVCVIDGVEYPVYKDAALTQQATLSDVYSTYFIYNNTGTTWTDEVNWDDVYTGGEVPYSTRPVSSVGDTIINFDYMRVRSDVEFLMSYENGYIDVFKLYRDGLITGSVIYTDTKPTAEGSNVSARGISGTGANWTYTVAGGGDDEDNVYTLLNIKYGQRIYEDYPVGGSWLTVYDEQFYTWDCNDTNFTSRREDLSDAFFYGSGRNAATYPLNAEFENNEHTALMYAIECLPDETADFTISGIGYKVQTHLCEVVNSSGNFNAKELLGCSAGVNPKEDDKREYYSGLSSSSAHVGGTSVRTLFGTTYWEYYDKYTGVDSLEDIDRAYIFYYDRLDIRISFNFGYDADGDGTNETVTYEDIAFGIKLDEYQFGAPDYAEHSLLNREGYEFAGWLDANGFVLEAEDWESIVATGDSENNTMIFIAKWEKISNNIAEYYEDRSSTEPFESHYFDDGEFMQYPTMTVYPDSWVWQEYGESQFRRFDWEVPMYGEYGVQETREISGEEKVVNVIRIYGAWDESHTRVIYDPNAPQGGIPGTAPIDYDEYTIWQSEVPVASRGDTANSNPDMVFAGWQLDRNGIVYQPGDHVPVQWPRTMIFTAQWAGTDEVVYLRYDPNGGTPKEIYPNDTGFQYKKNASAAVWNNTGTDGSGWFSRAGYVFAGWNTEPDGSGTSYAPDTSIVLTAPVTTLYAQWEKTFYTLFLNKVDSESNTALTGAEFGLYKQEDGVYLLVESFTTDVDGRITFLNLETDTLYKLVEEKPPNGYAVIAKEILFRLKPNEGTAPSPVFYDSAGNVISAPNGVTGEYITGNKLLTLNIKNLRGYELPSTGGTGIFFNMLCGLILVSAPFIYAVSLRRKRRSRE